MYVSKCQYWNEVEYVWSSDGCEVNKTILSDSAIIDCVFDRLDH